MIGYQESVNMEVLRDDFSRIEAEQKIADIGESDLWKAYEKHLGRKLTGKDLNQFVIELEIFVAMEVLNVGFLDKEIGGFDPDMTKVRLREVDHGSVSS